MVAKPLFIRVNLPMATWGYAILHATILICKANKLSQNSIGF